MSVFLISKHQSVLIYPNIIPKHRPCSVLRRRSPSFKHEERRNSSGATCQKSKRLQLAACACSLQKWIYSSIGCVYIYMHMQNYADMISTKILCTSEYPWLGVRIFTKGGPGTSDSQQLFGFEPRTAQNSPAPGMICGVPELGSYAVTVSNPPTFKRYPSCPSHCPSHLGSG